MNRLCAFLAVALIAAASVRAEDAGVRAPRWYSPGVRSSSPPSRIVSLAPVVTETLFALGAGDRVVGVTRFCDRPAAARALPQIGGYTDASLEAVLALRPDLVVAMPSMAQRALLDRLREQGVAVFVVFADTPAETAAMMSALGDVVANPAAARALVARQEDTLAALARRAVARGRTAVVVVGLDPLVVAGPGTFADVALRATGAASGTRTGDPQWPQWSLESLLSRRVDVVVAAEGPAGGARLRAMLRPLGARAPVVVAAEGPILMRPGPSFVDDALVLERLLGALAPSP